MGNRLSIVGLICVAVLCCNNPEEKEVITLKRDSTVLNKVIFYYEDSIIKNSRQELFVKHLGRLMELPEIEGNNADLYLRIWFWGPGNKYVVNLSKVGENYSIQIIEWHVKTADSSQYLILDRVWQNIVPRSGWKSFWASVQKLQNYEDGKKAEELKSQLTLMSYVQFEAGQYGKYRFFEYLEPSFYRYVDSPSNKIYNFLKNLNDELNIEVYQPADSLYLSPKS